MPRKARDERLNTRNVRLALTPRREPYWRTIQEGRAIGYRRLASGKAGTWIARHYDPTEGRKYHSLGVADDMTEADGSGTMTFAQAQEAARLWFRGIDRAGGRVEEPVTVAEALDSYVADYQARGGKALIDLNRIIAAHIKPAFGTKRVDELTTRAIKAWHNGLAIAPARLRTKAKAEKPNVRVIAEDDAEGHRARRSTANRVLTILKAALTLAFRDGRVASDEAWRRVKPFAAVDAARIRYLTDPEAVRLVNACGPELRRLVTAALLTGCRYGELCKLQARDFDPTGKVLHIRAAKGGKARVVHLTEEAERFFTTEAAGKPRLGVLIPRDDGEAWGKSHQFLPLRTACAAAKIAPAVSFHIIRHTFASRMVAKGVPLSIIAAALGNSEAICAKHYAHLAPDYLAKQIREHAGGLEIVPKSNVAPLNPKRKRAG